MLSDNAEDYLESIYDLTRNGTPAKTKDIARRLKVSPASVTEMIQKLSRDGYLDYERYKGVTLTPTGLRMASRVKRRHRLLERFLGEVLGVNGKEGEEEACRLEHIVSDESVKKICQLVNEPDRASGTLPYPECRQDCDVCADRSSITLDQLVEGQRGLITHLRCENPGKVRRLISMGFVPGRTVEFEESIPMGGPLLVKLEDCRVALAKEYARLVHIRRCS